MRQEVRPVDPSRPLVESRYRVPLDGIEPMGVFLVILVTQLQPGVMLGVDDVVVG